MSRESELLLALHEVETIVRFPTIAPGPALERIATRHRVRAGELALLLYVKGIACARARAALQAIAAADEALSHVPEEEKRRSLRPEERRPP